MIAALAFCAVQAPPTLRALLVGTTKYADKSGIVAPRGVSEDILRMRAVCRAYGQVVPSVLSGPAATLEGIQEGLDRVAKEAKPGDVCLFYFSGKGSGKAGAPSLVAADGTLNSDANDLTITALTTWAKAVEAAGAKPVMVIDACWPLAVDLAKGQTKEFHPYDETPRSVARGKAVEGPAYTGPGVMLSAGSAKGRTYDWQITEDTWSGAFTDLVGQSVVAAGLRSEPLSLATIFRNVQRTADEYREAGYIPDLYPQLTGDGETPLMGRAPSLTQTGELGRILTVEKERATKYRVAFNVDLPGGTPEDKNALYLQVRGGLREKLGSGISIVLKGARPDAILTIRKKQDEVYVELPRDEIRGGSPPMAYPLAAPDPMVAWLQRQSLFLRLFRVLDAGTPTLTTSSAIKTTLPTSVVIPEGTKVGLSAEVTPPVPGVALVLDRGTALNVVHLYTPQFTNSAVLGGPEKPVKVGGEGWNFSPDVVGSHEWRMLVVDGTDLKLPPLPPTYVRPKGTLNDEQRAAQRSARTAFDAAIVPYLTTLLDAVESGKSRWTGLVLPYTVTVQR